MRSIRKYGVFLAALAVILFYTGKYFYLRPSVLTGDTVPGFTAALIDGSEYSSDSLRGHYTLIDFWASWCGPCRQESPKVRGLYEKYHEREFRDAGRFRILSIALDPNSQAFEKAVAYDQLAWPWHIRQAGQFKDELPRLFGVKQIPTTLLVGPNGRVLALNAPMDVYDKILSDKLK